MTETAGNGHYWRDGAGVWRYTVSGRPVPGARPAQLLDAERPWCPVLELDGVTYRVVPRWRLEGRPALARACAQEGVLAEDEDGELARYLVPVAIWPAWPDPAGGMWAPELEQMIDARAVAELMGYSRVGSVWEMLARGEMAAPVLQLQRGSGLPRGVALSYWTRPVIEQWRERYRELRPLRYDAAAKLATQRRRREERAANLAAAGRRVIRRRRSA